MSNSLSPQWVKFSLLKLLDDSPKAKYRRQFTSPKIVQVTRVYADIRMLEISDKQNRITLSLTDATMKHLQSQDAFNNLEGLRNSVIKIFDWHFTTITQSVDVKHIPKAFGAGVSLPFSIQCNKIEMLGAEDCVIFGQPSDINSDKQLREQLPPVYNAHALLVKHLCNIQFPGEDCLPNSGTAYCCFCHNVITTVIDADSHPISHLHVFYI